MIHPESNIPLNRINYQSFISFISCFFFIQLIIFIFHLTSSLFNSSLFFYTTHYRHVHLIISCNLFSLSLRIHSQHSTPINCVMLGRKEKQLLNWRYEKLLNKTSSNTFINILTFLRFFFNGSKLKMYKYDIEAFWWTWKANVKNFFSHTQILCGKTK